MSVENHLEKLITHYQKSLIIKPENIVAYNHIGGLYTIQQKFEEASYYFIKSIQLNPDYVPTYYKLRFALQRLNWFRKRDNASLFEDGVLTLRNVIENKSDFPFANVVLGELIAHQNKIDEAIACYQSASCQTLSSYPQLVSQSWDNNRKRQPDFLIIGFPKCGTTSLYAYLTSHPQILPAVTKEIRYFMYSQIHNIDYYLAHFPCITDTSYLTGEATPSYISFPGIASKAFRWFPNLKLVILLRCPVKRTISSYYYRLRYLNSNLKLIEDLIPQSLSRISEALEQISEFLRLRSAPVNYIKHVLDNKVFLGNENRLFPGLLGSFYISYMEEWLDVFPKEQFLILRSEDLFKQPTETMSKVYDFLGLPDHSLPEYRNFNSNSYPPLSSYFSHQLAELFRPYNRQLEERLGMTFNWM